MGRVIVLAAVLAGAFTVGSAQAHTTLCSCDVSPNMARNYNINHINTADGHYQLKYAEGVLKDSVPAPQWGVLDNTRHSIVDQGKTIAQRSLDWFKKTYWNDPSERAKRAMKACLVAGVVAYTNDQLDGKSNKAAAYDAARACLSAAFAVMIAP